MKELDSGRATTITVASGKGGTGKTSFSVNFSIALAALGKKVMVVDADFGLSNVDVMLGAQPKYNLGHVLSGEVNMADAISLGHGGIFFIAGGSGLDSLLDMKKSELNTIYKQILSLDKDFDYVIFDGGAGINDAILRLINSTDESILVATPEPTSVMDAFVLLKSVAAKTRKPPVRIVMNRVDNQMEGLAMSRNLKNIVLKYLDYEVNYLGSISQDKNFVRSVKEQVPLMIRYPGCRAAKDLESIAYTFAQVAPPTFTGGLHRFFDKVMMGYGNRSTEK
ncbi:MinD/ParA family protein [Christensenellaceae bacterium OttesenSCG-928-M15]|nr:MinD/ParA family protein [Christensenellaceae bacterium OttesenSCG-928-M15]